MQIQKPIRMYLPGLFVAELERKLNTQPPEWKYQIEYFYYLANCLIVKQIQQNKNEFFSMNIPKMKDAIIWNIDRYINYLVKGELLKRDYFINGIKSYHYQINSALSSGFKAVLILPNVSLYDKLVKQQRIRQKHYNDADRHPIFLCKMWQKFKSLDFDYTAARNWIESQSDEKKKHSYHSALALLEDRRFRYFHRNRTNYRLDTNLTNLKKDLRQFIKGDYVQIDLANSQPFFLSQILIDFYYLSQNHNSHTKAIPLCCSCLNINLNKYFGLQVFKRLSKIPLSKTILTNGELLNFKESCEAGIFYDDFLTRISGIDLNRDKIKKMMFAVLFSKNVIYKQYRAIIPYYKEKVLFKQLYPIIYKMVYSLKEKDHAKLAILLQQIESKVFIDIICPELAESGIIPLTIHDSIIVERKHIKTAINVCENVFHKVFGVVPTFHLEPLKKLSD
jgi:hypothetical protein